MIETRAAGDAAVMGEAAAQALRAGGDYVVVTGRHWGAAEAVVRGAALHVRAPGPSTRLAVAEGVALGGRRAVTVLDAAVAGAGADGAVVITESAAVAATALAAGWQVAQPWTADDVAPVLAFADGPVVLVLGPVPDSTPEPAPPVRRVRQWRDGSLATLATAGPAVGPMLHLGDRLLARGVEVNLVEVTLLTRPEQAPLLGGDAVLVGTPEAAGWLRRGLWPAEPLHRVPLTGRDDADLIGDVLSHVRVGR